MIAGVVIAVIAVLIIAGVVGFLIYRKRKKAGTSRIYAQSAYQRTNF